MEELSIGDRGWFGFHENHEKIKRIKRLEEVMVFLGFNLKSGCGADQLRGVFKTKNPTGKASNAVEGAYAPVLIAWGLLCSMTA